MKLKSPMILASLFALLLATVSVVSQADETPEKILAGWGTVTDVDKDCEISSTAEKLTITVPATIHDLHPSRSRNNAPRVLKKVKGDFTVQVKVTGEFNPGMVSKGKGAPFNGAGILIWQNEENYLRVERNAYWVGQERLFCYPPLIEYWRNREYSGANEAPVDVDYFKGKSTWLKASRQGKNVTVSISHDGKAWTEVKSIPVEMAAKLSVGVAALNTSDTPFKVEFEELTITGQD